MVEAYFNELRRLENLAKLRDINNVLDNLYKLKHPNQPLDPESRKKTKSDYQDFKNVRHRQGWRSELTKTQ